MNTPAFSQLAERLAAAVHEGRLSGPQATSALGYAAFTTLGHHNVVGKSTSEHLSKTTLRAFRP